MTLHLCVARTGSRGVEEGYTPPFKLGRIGFGSYVRDYTSVRAHQRSRRSNLFLPASAPAVSEKKATSHRRSHTPEALYGEGPWFTAFVDPEVVNTIRPVNKEPIKKEEVVWSHRTKRSRGVESAQTAVFQLYRQGRVSPRHRLPGVHAQPAHQLLVSLSESLSVACISLSSMAVDSAEAGASLRIRIG
jgi:hypothetical protein